jgi:hypothetical protein
MTRSRQRAFALVCAAGVLGVAGALAACSQDSAGSAGTTDASPDSTASGADADAASTSPDGGPDAEASADVATDGSLDATVDDGGGDASDGGCGALGAMGEATELRCTGLYSDWATKTVSPDVVEYDPGLHLWSDGAVKTRWIYLPPGGATDGGRMPIDTSNMNEWTFPVGTKLWKEFVLGGKRVETRLLWKQDVGAWYRTTYAWAPDGSTATELMTGMLDADGDGYEIPTQTECNTCHNGRLDGVLGFEAVSLASADASPSLSAIASLGWITEAPDASLAIPGNAVDVAALGYLHANCGIACHNAGSGMARGTGFHMRLDVATLATVETTDTYTTGVNQATRLGFQIAGDDPTLRLAPYDAGASCVDFRMSHRDGQGDAGMGTQMPPIDTHKIDDAGVAIIEQWIAQGCQ